VAIFNEPRWELGPTACTSGHVPVCERIVREKHRDDDDDSARFLVRTWRESKADLLSGELGGLARPVSMTLS